MMTVSQYALNLVLQDIRNGNSKQYIEEFFEARPDWTEQDDEKEEKSEESAQA